MIMLITIVLSQRVEEIKNKRQAHHIFQRMKAGRKLQKQKDIKEVERDLALIKSPAAGLKAAAKAREEEMEGMEDVEVDTSINIGEKEVVGRRREALIEEVHESDHEMVENDE